MNSKGLAQLAYEKGMYILTAAQSYQAALEAAQLGHGYLTYALVEEGLKATAPIISRETARSFCASGWPLQRSACRRCRRQRCARRAG